MRIVVVTQDEPFYLPSFLERLAEARGNNIVAMVILQPFDETLLDVGRRLYRFFGPMGFAVECFHFALAKGLDFLNQLRPMFRPYSAADVARRHGIPVLRPADINAAEFTEVLRDKIRPDLLVSVAASQIFKSEILSIPHLGCINVHSAPLPRYQGMMPNFWAMLHGEKLTAVTVHYMVEKLDAGDIILQEPVPIQSEDTLHSLIVRSKAIGANVLLAAIKQIEDGTADARPMPADGATYFSFPKRQDAERFRAQGRRFR
jgi:methionyl-tRNA formyltransferase